MTVAAAMVAFLEEELKKKHSPSPPFVTLSDGMVFFLNSAFACVIKDAWR